MSQNQKTKMKLAILKDARKIISTNKAIVPRMGNAFVKLRPKNAYNDESIFYRWANNQRNKQFDTSVLKNSKKTVCQVCALGALLLADIDRNNHAKVQDVFGWVEAGGYLNNRSRIHLRLQNYFSDQELDEIEACFEQWDNDPPGAPKMHAATRHIDDDSERLIAILDFLIAHDGKVC